MKLVVDASVIVKWVFANTGREENAPQALSLLDAIRDGHVFPVQPPHWLAEVAAVIARLSPETVEASVALLDALELPVRSDVAVYRLASRIAVDLGHHLFDTLYHAVALESGCALVTADDTYYLKARKLGSLVRLAAWSPDQISAPR